MRVFVAGARGFIGRHLVQSLSRQSGVQVIPGVRPGRASEGGEGIAFDFRTDHDPSVWLKRLEGVDAVAVCVGVLRQSKKQPIESLHDLGPCALFEACQRLGIPVHHVSALGISQGISPYAVTKRRAEQRLAQLAAEAPAWKAQVYRPSIVFGRGGASSALFMNLARMPVLLMPGPVLQTAIQPVWVQDLTDAMARAMVNDDARAPGLSSVDVVGETALPMGDFIAELRKQLGHSAAWQLTMPHWMVETSAWLGDQVEASPWCHETLSMLGTPNTGDPTALRAMLGRPLLPLADFVRTGWRHVGAR